MGLKITKKPPAVAHEKVETLVKGKTIAEENSQEEVADQGIAEASPSTEGPWAEVGVDMSYTHNMGNFQSCRMGVSLKVPCVAGEINDVYEYAKAWAEERMNALIADLPSEGE